KLLEDLFRLEPDPRLLMRLRAYLLEEGCESLLGVVVEVGETGGRLQPPSDVEVGRELLEGDDRRGPARLGVADRLLEQSLYPGEVEPPRLLQREPLDHAVPVHPLEGLLDLVGPHLVLQTLGDSLRVVELPRIFDELVGEYPSARLKKVHEVHRILPRNVEDDNREVLLRLRDHSHERAGQVRLSHAGIVAKDSAEAC